MKHVLVLVFALLLTAGLAWAEEPAVADPPVEEGGCELPDFTGMSEEEIQAAALAAGFGLEPVWAQPPTCPVRFSCSSINNCGIGLCAVADIGPCCSPSTGLQLCCISGTIKVRTCPCVCTGGPCALNCVNSTDVSWRCV